jgi:quinoprotein dehydrogenase-associated probable ABC transporter substrate-binding protein
MSLRCLDRGRTLAAVFGALMAGAATAAAPLRVCADPDNLPYSHRNGDGFENRIAALLADEIGADLVLVWTPLQRGFVRKTAGEGLCEVYIGVPTAFDRVATTRPLYRSTYVVVQRAADPAFDLDDPALPVRRIGVQLPGGDFSATAPGHALVVRGALERVVGFPVVGSTPAAQRMVSAVADGVLDAAIVWGPQAAWWVRRAGSTLVLRPARLPDDPAAPPAAFSISVGVARTHAALVPLLNAAIERRRAGIDRILDDYGVPRLPLGVSR